LRAANNNATQRYSDPEALFRAHHVQLVRTLTLATGDAELAADAVQEAFVQLCLHWSRIERYDDPVAWVRRVAVHRAANLRRSLERRGRALMRLGHESGATAFEGDRPETRERHLGSLPSAMMQIPQRQRLAVSLHYLEGLSTVETARAMGVTEGAVKRHLFRARKALLTLLEVE
jgi:RNA polymerase sigma-70 factor, ECF subfamily